MSALEILEGVRKSKNHFCMFCLRCTCVENLKWIVEAIYLLGEIDKKNNSGNNLLNLLCILLKEMSFNICVIINVEIRKFPWT